MPENYEFIDNFKSTKMSFLDSDRGGSNWLFTWTLYDLPYPKAGVELLGSLEIGKLDELIELAKFKETTITIKEIRGHSSAEGKVLDNYYLAESRAKAVKEYLLNKTRNSNLAGFISSTTSIQSFGEDIPEIKFGNDDHPLNRRVEIDILIHYKNSPSKNPPNPPKGRNWKIDYKASLSFYKSIGFQFGFGTLELLNQTDKNSRNPPLTKDFAYLAIGAGIKADDLMGGASKHMSKGARKKILLMQQRAISDAKKLASKGLPEWLTNAIKGTFESIKKIHDEINSTSSGFVNKDPQEQVMYFLKEIGFDVAIPNSNILNLDGKFITNNEQTFAGIGNSIQFVTGVSVSAAVGAGMNIQLTVVPIFINGQYAEWVVPIIFDVSLEIALVSIGAEASINISHFLYRE